MDSHQHNFVDAFLFAEVIDLLAALADTVEAYDVDSRMLAGPWVRRPLERLHDRSIASASGVIDGKIALLLRSTRAAGDDGKWRCHRRSVAHSLTPGSPFIEAHGVARRVDDHHAQTACGADDLIHPRRHRGDA